MPKLVTMSESWSLSCFSDLLFFFEECFDDFFNGTADESAGTGALSGMENKG